MKEMYRVFICAVAVFLATSSLAIADPSANQICQKMIAEGRGGGQSQNDCLCIYRVADAVLDEDIKALLFDSWYNGTNNMQTMVLLPNPGRVEKQLRTMQRSLRANCE